MFLERFMSVISDWFPFENLPTSPFSFPLQHSFQYIHWQFLSTGNENQKVGALICTNHNMHN